MKNRIIAALTAAAFICISLSGCAAASKEPMTYTDTVFDTVVSITVYDSTDQEILDECKSMCQKYDAMFSATNPDSEISRINQGRRQSGGGVFRDSNPDQKRIVLW